jgi:hypothetical protein
VGVGFDGFGRGGVRLPARFQHAVQVGGAQALSGPKGLCSFFGDRGR